MNLWKRGRIIRNLEHPRYGDDEKGIIRFEKKPRPQSVMSPIILAAGIKCTCMHAYYAKCTLGFDTFKKNKKKNKEEEIYIPNPKRRFIYQTYYISFYVGVMFYKIDLHVFIFSIFLIILY